MSIRLSNFPGVLYTAISMENRRDSQQLKAAATKMFLTWVDIFFDFGVACVSVQEQLVMMRM